MSNPDVWMPVYIGDYMADTAHLGALEHGAYLMLMFHYWRHHSLPQDDAKLSRIAKCTAREWSSIKDTILGFFGPDLSHKRIDHELEEAASNSQKAKERAEKAAAARWGKQSSSNATSIPQAVLDECPSPSPSPVKEPVAKATGKKTTMPTGFDLTPERRAYAQQQRISDVEREWSKFIDYCLSNRKLYADWDAAWRNWCRSPYQQPAQNRSGGNGQRSGSPGSGSLAGAMRAVLAAGGEPGIRTGGVSGGQAFDAGTTSADPDPFAELDAAFGSPVRHPGSHALPVIDQEPVEG